MLDLAVALALSPLIAIDPPVLTVDNGAPQLVSREGLLGRLEVTQVHIDSPDFGGARDVPAISLADLLAITTPGEGTVEVTCADGFVAELPRAQALQRDPRKPIAYLAIDPLDGSWPTAEGHYPGPFAVVWSQPPGPRVAREEWPYQVVKVALGGTLAQRYPLLVPRPGAAEARGFQRFATHCLPCHPVNGQGPAEVGPDLNVPQSPLEYLGKVRLTAYVRDPQSLHRWKAARMPPFPETVLSKEELDDVIAYLSERWKHR